MWIFAIKRIKRDVTTYQERLGSYCKKMLHRIRKSFLRTQTEERYCTPPEPPPMCKSDNCPAFQGRRHLKHSLRNHGFSREFPYNWDHLGPGVFNIRGIIWSSNLPITRCLNSVQSRSSAELEHCEDAGTGFWLCWNRGVMASKKANEISMR